MLAGLDPEPAGHLAQGGGIAQPRGVQAGVVLQDRLLDAHPPETAAEVVGRALVGHLPAPEDGVGEPLHHALDQVHQVPEVRVGLVELEHRELGVVPRGQPLVAEVAVDLVDALEPADDEPLQVKLRCDAQVHVHAERVVPRDEGLRRRAAGDRLHHRRLDLHEALRVEERAQVAHDARARAEDAPAFLADDQVDVALAVAGLGVGQSVPLVRKRPERLGQEPRRLRLDGQLAGPRAHQGTLDAHDVPDVPALERLVGVTQRVDLKVDLDLPGRVLQLGEGGLAHHPLEHHAAGDPDADRVGLQRLVRMRPEGGVKVRCERVAAEVVREGIALLAQPGELGPPLCHQLVLVRGGGRGLVGHRLRVPVSGWLRGTGRGRRRAPPGCCRPRRPSAGP